MVSKPKSFPAQGYREEMLGHHQRFGFDYMVGSVHYVDEISIDSEDADFKRAIDECGGLEALAVRYYENVAEMVAELEPDVVGHLDLIRKNAAPDFSLDTPKIRRAADGRTRSSSRTSLYPRPQHGRLPQGPRQSLPRAVACDTGQRNGNSVLSWR